MMPPKSVSYNAPESKSVCCTASTDSSTNKMMYSSFAFYIFAKDRGLIKVSTSQKMKFSIKDFFSKCD